MRRKMPFGKFRGQPLRDVPAAYLAFLRDKVDDLHDDLREGIETELVARELIAEAARWKAIVKERRRVKKTEFEHDTNNWDAARIIWLQADKYPGLPLLWAERVLRRGHPKRPKGWHLAPKRSNVVPIKK